MTKFREFIENVNADIPIWELYNKVVVTLAVCKYETIIMRNSNFPKNGSEQDKRQWVTLKMHILANGIDYKKTPYFDKIADAVLFITECMVAEKHVLTEIFKLKEEFEANLKKEPIRNLFRSALETLKSDDSLEDSAKLCILYGSLTYYEKGCYNELVKHLKDNEYRKDSIISFIKNYFDIEVSNEDYFVLEPLVSKIISLETGRHSDVGVVDIRSYIHYEQAKENHQAQKNFDYLFNTIPKIGKDDIWDFTNSFLSTLPNARKSIKLRIVCFALSVRGFLDVVKTLKLEDLQETKETAIKDYLQKEGVDNHDIVLPLILEILSVELGVHWIKDAMSYVTALADTEACSTYTKTNKFLKDNAIQTEDNSIDKNEKVQRKSTMEFPLFPVAINLTDFDNNGETSHGGGVLFTEPMIDIETPCYRFEVFGKHYKGLIVNDFPIDAIVARMAQHGKSDMRQMKVCLEEALGDKSFPLNVFLHISYYVRMDGKREVIFVLARKRS